VKTRSVDPTGRNEILQFRPFGGGGGGGAFHSREITEQARKRI
jgi:hypothetical protein